MNRLAVTKVNGFIVWNHVAIGRKWRNLGINLAESFNEALTNLPNVAQELLEITKVRPTTEA
jgi:hypothetical protein